MEIKNVTCGYGDAFPIKNLSVTIADEGCTAIMGGSGVGKTTFIKLLLGLVKPVEGEITGLDGKRIAVVFQEDRLLPWYSARRNVELFSEDEKTAAELLDDMELWDAADKLPSELSGGMQRRVSIARALAYGGDILLLDEPFKGLDGELKKRIISRIKGTFPLVIMVTHDEKDAELMGAGQIVRL